KSRSTPSICNTMTASLPTWGLSSKGDAEGAFLVRDCSRNTTNEPFVLAVFYENRVFNIQIRFCKETSKYTLGTRIKTNDTFDSVADIIKFHSIFPIVLIDGRNPSATSHPKRHCVLIFLHLQPAEC
uniref:SH2 domain-containing protein n=1 Tax=Pygocentrus nattereri TaxID=42514 RepID=A0AAR2KRB2_PYGNA